MLVKLRCLAVALALAVSASGCIYSCPEDCARRPGHNLFSCCDQWCYLADWTNCHSCVNRGCYNCNP